LILLKQKLIEQFIFHIRIW